MEKKTWYKEKIWDFNKNELNIKVWTGMSCYLWGLYKPFSCPCIQKIMSVVFGEHVAHTLWAKAWMLEGLFVELVGIGSSWGLREESSLGGWEVCFPSEFLALWMPNLTVVRETMEEEVLSV